jgi:L-seryl-tRNA(Ser) seleniumtransferase
VGLIKLKKEMTASIEFIVPYLEHLTYFGILTILVATGLGLPISEDLILITCGFLAYQGKIHISGALPICYLGVICGDLILYTQGYRYGQDILQYRWVKWSIYPMNSEHSDLEKQKRAYLRSIPSVDDMLQKVEDSQPRNPLLDSLREVLEGKRKSILQAHSLAELEGIKLSPETLLEEAKRKLSQQLTCSLIKVINATGIIVHTNLGRSLLCSPALNNLHTIGQSYSNLEYSLPSGERGSRNTHLEKILQRLTGAEAGLAVNNNAAAVLITLETLAKDKEVIVSRGELVEIGGSFRIPDIMRKSGARLIEVGTTNKTYLEDYEKAIGPETALLLKVHPSNFRILGFTASVNGEDLVELGRRYNLPVMEDLGSGNLIDLSRYGLGYEPTVQEAIRTGIDIVTFSGDKLLGGPQAGIILGKKYYIDALKKNPLMRAVRVDKLTIAALEATLKLYLDEEMALKEIPTLRMLAMPKEEIEKRAHELIRKIDQSTDKHDLWAITLEDGYSQVGGGALPLEQIPTKVIAVRSGNISPDRLEEFFRHHDPPILGRIHKERLCLDLRTVLEDEEKEIIKAFRRLATQR